jgi:hypothetical protein
VRIENIAARLTVSEILLREAIIDEIILQAAPLNEAHLATLSAKLNLPNDMAYQLEAKNVLGRDGQGDIAYVYPVSAHPTRHKISLHNGKRFHAMCAIDSLGCAFTFKQDVSIDSACSFCNEPISVKIADQQLTAYRPANLHVLRFNLDSVDSLNSNR